MRIKCICYDLPISEIMEWAERMELNSVYSIQKTLRICDKCKLCNKYIEEEFNKNEKTDSTAFDARRHTGC
jgi:hypothetical protein